MGKLKKQKLSTGKHIAEPKTDLQNPDAQYPVFSFRYLQSNFGISTCNGEQILSFVSKLQHASQLTWGNWKLAPRSGMGYEKIARTVINTAIPHMITDDVEYFLSFRFHNGRCVGYRDVAVFFVLWIDGSFKLYRH